MPFVHASNQILFSFVQIRMTKNVTRIYLRIHTDSIRHKKTKTKIKKKRKKNRNEQTSVWCFCHRNFFFVCEFFFTHPLAPLFFSFVNQHVRSDIPYDCAFEAVNHWHFNGNTTNHVTDATVLFLKLNDIEQTSWKYVHICTLNTRELLLVQLIVYQHINMFTWETTLHNM